MHIQSVGCAIAGLISGWYLKGLFPTVEEKIPCNCHCQCAHHVQQEGTSTPFWPGVILALFVGILGLAANFVLAVRFTVSDKGQNREVAISVKGKSKGVYNPSRALQITD